MPKRIPVCQVGAIPEGESTVVSAGDKVVAVFHENGCYYAIDDRCPHAGASLSSGHVENGIVTCPWHAWRFRLKDGAWADNPRVKTGTYSVVIDDGKVHLEIADSKE